MQCRRRIELRRKLAAFDAGADVGLCRRGRLLKELEPLEVLAETRDRSIGEHQLEVLRVDLRELIERPQTAAEPIERIDVAFDRLFPELGQQAKAFLRQREE